MTYDKIHTLFKQRYNQSNWKQFLGEAFPNSRLLATPEILTGIDSNVASQAQKLGYITLNENGIERQIAVYEVTLAQGIILERNRVGLRNLLRKYWKDIDAAFIAYHRPDTSTGSAQGNWRFTYVSELTGYDTDGEFVQLKTEPKRYTYVLGEGESTRTAAERFTAIANKGSKATLDDVKEAFSVEKLSKAFFDEYKKHYDIFCDFMVSKPSIRQTIFNGDEKGIRDFNKKLLGRIVFLYFIQKKGWLGVPINEDWGKGNFNFLTKQFENFKNPDLFYSEFLSDLFFTTLNSKRDNDIFKPNHSSFKIENSALIKIPYLNGGLFEEEDKKHRNLIFPANLFNSLFEFFNQYNFTIYEDDPNDHTVAVDPEMLGHIFENLLEDNKDKGAYYTPKEIVHYMCQESLIEYLTTWFENKGYEVTGYIGFDKPDQPKLFSVNEGRKGQMILETEVSTSLNSGSKTTGKQIDRILIEKLLKKKLDDEDEKLIKKHSAEFHNALDTVKICDPAIGSGAFPMGLLHEIFTAKQTLHHFDKGNLIDFKASDVKLNIIQNSIYGVDIEKGAVDIARLRFWLSLIVDEEKPKALPNLDYKIVVGNSLVSKLGDDIIDIDWTLKEGEGFQANIFGSADLHANKGKILKKISQEQKDFFNPESDKKKLGADIRNLKIDLLINQLALMVTTKGLETLPAGRQVNLRGTGKQLAQRTALHLQTIGWKDSIKDLQKLKNKPELPLHFFDWKLDFPEVMNEQVIKNVGFDIVIANPPYVDYRLIENSVTSHSKFPINKSSSRPNLYQYFVELSDNLINEKGTSCFINPNQFLSTDNGIKLREHLIGNRSIKFIVDVSYLKVFKEASTYTIVWLFNKISFKANQIRINRCSEIEKLGDTSFHIKQQEIELTQSKIIPINFEYFALAKIEKGKEILANVAKMKWGTSATGYGQKKITHDNFESLTAAKKKLYKPILQTSDTKKYFINWQEEYIPISIYSDTIIKEFNKPKLVIGRVTKQIQACLDEEKCFVGKATLITDSKIELRLLLAILNSTFANKWYYLKFETTHMAGGYLRYDIPYLEKLPIPLIPKKSANKLSRLVEKIISEKNKDITINTSQIENEIDNLVYKLYELSYDEVKVIDPAFSLSEQEYKNIKLD